VIASALSHRGVVTLASLWASPFPVTAFCANQLAISSLTLSILLFWLSKISIFNDITSRESLQSLEIGKRISNSLVALE
jgi:hypothetical protein